MSKAEILEQLPTLGPNDQQEILDRFCDLQEAELRETHQRWVDDALSSGPARPATPAEWEDALQRGLARAANRS